jgi:hypothetical protein
LRKNSLGIVFDLIQPNSKYIVMRLIKISGIILIALIIATACKAKKRFLRFGDHRWQGWDK